MSAICFRGSDAEKINGVFDELTQTSVLAHQKAQKIVGEATDRG